MGTLTVDAFKGAAYQAAGVARPRPDPSQVQAMNQPSAAASAASAKSPAKKTAAKKAAVVASKAAATRVVGAARVLSPVPAISKGTVCIMFTGFNPTRDHMEVSIELLIVILPSKHLRLVPLHPPRLLNHSQTGLLLK